MPYVDKKKAAEAQKRYREQKKERDGRSSKRWIFVFYPDSAPENWNDIIGEWMCEVLVSPLHDKDVNPDGEPKKPHWHGIVKFERAKTQTEAMELIGQLNGPRAQIPAGSTRSCVRYLVHADNPEKASYSRDSVLSFGGWSWDDACTGDEETMSIVGEMMEWCDETGCTSYAQLLRYARRERKDWFRSLCTSSTYVMKNYLNSLRYEA
ncbi:replication protein [Faecalibaculum rodentium]|uniref:Replication protein n=1 Tax=Faecalibaculum rodentium TaxID=1702221 RepID=A0A1Q9YN81_9FIRM|nr:replication protein [Faecalibaculum rodentium]OLU47227.1 hypothetical protein BO223_00795 [Faecalibaculum rodentium]